MRTFCAFLRGVNVNGRNIKMAEACEVFRTAGMEQVSSVLATGNIIFMSGDDRSSLCGILEAALDIRFQMESKLFIKDADEIRAIIDAVPYEPDSDWHIYSFICEPGFEFVLAKEFETAGQGSQSDESAAVSNGYFFWHVRKGKTLDTPFSKILGNKKYRENFTSRNLSTIEKIYAVMKSKTGN